MADENPYEPTALDGSVKQHDRSKLRDHPVLALLLSIILGMTFGLCALAFTIGAGAHGRDTPAVAYYTLGPAIWLWQFSVGSPSVFKLAGVMCVTWIAYWWFALVGTAKLPTIARLIAITAFHILFVVLYQLIIGLP
jgi:hypothetical protein